MWQQSDLESNYGEMEDIRSCVRENGKRKGTKRNVEWWALASGKRKNLLEVAFILKSILVATFLYAFL